MHAHKMLTGAPQVSSRENVVKWKYLDQCESCGNVFKSLTQLKKHLWYEHELFWILAQELFRNIFSLNNLETHRSSWQKKTLYSLRTCRNLRGIFMKKERSPSYFYKWNVNKWFFSTKPFFKTRICCRNWPYHVTNAKV